MAESPDKHIKCPECGYRLHWKLGDGRLKCKRCGKRFKHNPLKPGLKLDRKVEKEIARLFRLGVPAAKAARDLGIHGNTAYRHYKRLREQIAADREAQLEKLHGHIEADESYFGGERHGKRGRGAAGKIAVFGLLKRGGEVRVLLPKRCDSEQLVGAILDNSRGLHCLHDCYSATTSYLSTGSHERINTLRCISQGRYHINGIEYFWVMPKGRLKMYHGGFKKNFRLFISEMEFRFNHRYDQTALTIC
jgi:transposase